MGRRLSKRTQIYKKKNVYSGTRRKRSKTASSGSCEEWPSSDEHSEIDETNSDDEILQAWSYDIDALLVKPIFNYPNEFQLISGCDLTLDLIVENGLMQPLLITDPPESFGMKMPKAGTLTAQSIGRAVGDRDVEVINVRTQGGRKMSFKSFINYFESDPSKRKELLNLVSLEYSHTALAKKVRSPYLVREIDWIELYWPETLRKENSVDYPKVQNYCLMSVKGCFTDFHIDFGGTAVWYHVYKGKKIFWLIEPTEENILKYEDWILKGDHNEIFFGDIVSKCVRITLTEGSTFIIPAGWIHCVYTPEDSLVFGGNFLTSFSIPMQIRIHESEDKIMMAEKYRYPDFHRMHWYVVEGVIKRSTGQVYKAADELVEADENAQCCSNIDPESSNSTIIEGANSENQKMVCKVTQPENDAKENELVEGIDTDQSTAVNDGGNDVAIVENKKITEVKDNDTAVDKNLPFIYDDGYLSSISEMERNGYWHLLKYLQDQLENTATVDKEQKVRRDALIAFEQILNHKVSQLIVGTKSTEKSEAQKAPSKLTQWYTAFAQPKSAQGVKRKTPMKEKEKESIQMGRTKVSKMKTKNTKKADCHSIDGPLIVGGLPPPIMPADAPQAPNPYGYDPLASVTALGHKQLPSAYRRTADMASAPPSQKYRLQHIPVMEMRKTILPSEKKSESVNDSNAPGPSNNTKSDASEQTNIRERRNHMGMEEAINKSASREIRHSKIDYPELQYRSPLARPSSSSFSSGNFENKTMKRGQFASGIDYKRRSTDIGVPRRRFFNDQDSRHSNNNESWKRSMPPPPWSPANRSFSKQSQRSNESNSSERNNAMQGSQSRVGDEASQWASSDYSQYSQRMDRRNKQIDESSVNNLRETLQPEVIQKEPSGTNSVQAGNWRPLAQPREELASSGGRYVPLINNDQESNKQTAQLNSNKNVMSRVEEEANRNDFTNRPSIEAATASTSVLSIPPSSTVKSTEKVGKDIDERVVKNAGKVSKDIDERSVKSQGSLFKSGDQSQKTNEQRNYQPEKLDYMTTANELAKLAHEIDYDGSDMNKKSDQKVLPSTDPRCQKNRQINQDTLANTQVTNSNTIVSESAKISVEAALENLSSLTAEFNAMDS